MKKLLLMVIFWAAAAGVASATPVTCSVLMAANTSGNTGSTCTVTPDAGFFISSLTLTGTDDYTGLQSGDPEVMFDADLTQSPGDVFGATYCDVATDLGVGAGVPCNITVIPANTVTGLDFATYSIQLTDAMNTVTGGVVTGDSIVLHLDYAETEIPASPTPEPNTLSLMGIGLLGLGFLARMRTSRT